MMYYGNGMGAGGWILMSVVTVTLLGLLAVGIAALLRPTGGSQPPAPPVAVQAERVLAERFARGDIDAEEYEQRLRTLRGSLI